MKKSDFKGCWLAFAMAFGIFAASCVPQVQIPNSGISFIDKILHFFAYGAFATSICRMPYFYSRGTIGALAAIFAASIFGASDEFHQSFTGRSCDFFDWVADTSGATFAVLLYFLSASYRKILEFRFGFSKKRTEKLP